MDGTLTIDGKTIPVKSFQIDFAKGESHTVTQLYNCQTKTVLCQLDYMHPALCPVEYGGKQFAPLVRISEERIWQICGFIGE